MAKVKPRAKQILEAEGRSPATAAQAPHSPPSTDARTNLGCSAREATQRIELGGRHGSVTEDVEAQAPHLSHALNEPRDRKVGMAVLPRSNLASVEGPSVGRSEPSR